MWSFKLLCTIIWEDVICFDVADRAICQSRLLYMLYLLVNGLCAFATQHGRVCWPIYLINFFFSVLRSAWRIEAHRVPGRKV